MVNFGELAVPALLAGGAVDSLVEPLAFPNISATSPGLLIRQGGYCPSGWTFCADGCMPIGGVCCARYAGTTCPRLFTFRIFTHNTETLELGNEIRVM
jgi:hypothetical protein